MILKKYGEHIRQLRIQNGYTQEALAKKLDVDRSLLSHVEAGKRSCSVDLFVCFSDFFEVSLDLLILGRVQAPYLNSYDKSLLKADIVRLTNAINRGLEHPNTPEDVVALILQGVSARYDCCPNTIEQETDCRLSETDLKRFGQTASHITITGNLDITVHFK